jgi:enamine deaminase RidA (YjgF/YER057c/UK114 family)
MIYIAGQGGEDKNGNLSTDFAVQLKQAFTNLRIALDAIGVHPTSSARGRPLYPKD